MRLETLKSAGNIAFGLVAVCMASLRLQSHSPAVAGTGPAVLRPDEVLPFPMLYKENCAACHGENGKNEVAIPLANPVYLDVAEKPFHEIIANGVPGKLMPPFAKFAGGMLTDQQVAACPGYSAHVGQPGCPRRTKPSTLCHHSTRRSDPRPASLRYLLRPLPRRRWGRRPRKIRRANEAS